MKKIFLFLFVVTLAVSALHVSAMTPESDTADTPVETWKVITTANNHQVITVHLNEKLAVRIYQFLQWGQDRDFSFKIADQNLLNEVVFDGRLRNTSTSLNDSYIWIFQPLGVGETTLTFTKNYFFSSKESAEFTINVVE